MMRRRLVERFGVNVAVQVYFPARDEWVDGVVVRHQHPAIWVRTWEDGRVREWFVTNGARVRPVGFVCEGDEADA